jgi:hypothetical protein
MRFLDEKKSKLNAYNIFTKNISNLQNQKIVSKTN